jgi:hypothetical protein
MIPYAVAVGVGLAAISDQIEAVATRMWPGSRRIGTLATALMAIMVGLLSVKSLSDIYASNPKQRPNDLREGFDYVRSRIQPNDLLLEASTSKEGPVFWFKSFNSYYLRGFSPPPAVTTIETTNFPKVISTGLGAYGSSSRSLTTKWLPCRTVPGQTLTSSASGAFAPSTGMAASGRCWSRSSRSSTNSPISTRIRRHARSKVLPADDHLLR